MCTSCFRAAHPDAVPPHLEMRVEIIVLAEVERRLQQCLSKAFAVIWDCPPNCDTRLRPDRVWFFNVNERVITLHLEVDEDGAQHEDDDSRVAVLQCSMGAHESWLVRFNTAKTVDRPTSVRRKRLSNGNHTFERAGDEWEYRMHLLCEKLRNICTCIANGDSPSTDDWKTKLFF
jgi:hypothetical protein